MIYVKKDVMTMVWFGVMQILEGQGGGTLLCRTEKYSWPFCKIELLSLANLKGPFLVNSGQYPA